jgi:hypothetical protein
MRHRRGDTKTLEFPVRDQFGVPYALVPPSTATWEMGKPESNKGGVSTPRVVLLHKAIGSGLSIETEVEGLATLYVITVNISSADTKLLPAGTYYHEIEIIDADGNVLTPDLDDAGRFDLVLDFVVTA